MRVQLYDILSNYAALTSIVGDRIYPQRVPISDALPYVVFTVTDRNVSYDQGGYDKYNHIFVDIESCGVTIAQADSVAKEVFNALAVQNQEVGPTGDKEQLCATTLLSESDDFYLFDGSEDGVRSILQTYEITYLEA